jgi:pilus assembly protein CpaE
VLAPSGGCGASTIAVNLASLLARARGHCHLIDLNLGKADLGPLLDLKPTYTLADLCRHEDRLDRTLYEKLLTAHDSGVSLLAAPRHFDDLPSVTATGIAKAVEIARQAYSEVVVDLENCVHVEQLAVLTQATTVLLVCRLEFTAVRNTRRALDHLTARGVPADRVEVVVNQVGLAHELPLSEAEVAFAGKRTRFVPHDPEVVGWANNTGIPAAVSHPHSEVVQAVAKLVGLESEVAPRRGRLSRLAGWLHGSRRAEPVVSRPRTYSEPVLTLEPLTAEKLKNHDPVSNGERAAADSRPCAV